MNFLGINKNYQSFSKEIEKSITDEVSSTKIEIDRLTRIQRVNVKREGNREVTVTLRSTDGTTKVKIPLYERKIKIREFISAISDTGDLQKNTAKANSCRKIVCDILRYYSHVLRENV